MLPTASVRYAEQLPGKGVDTVAMKSTTVLVGLFTLVVSACGSKTNPNVCCTDEANCSAQGLPNTAMCSDGLVCRGNTCVAETCSTSAQCEAGAPYCLATGLCADACDADAECPGFGGVPGNVYCAQGTCAACRMNNDCTSAAPVCEAGTCRGCKADSECPSRACGDNGMCIASQAAVYVDGTTGIDAGTCTQAAPCATVQYGIQNALANRSHVVIAPGNYVGRIGVTSMDTSAPAMTIHGGGATFQQTPGSDTGVFYVGDVATTISDLTFVASTNGFGESVTSATAPCVVSNVKVQSGGGFQVGANMTLTDVDISNPTLAAITLNSESHLLLDRVSIRGGMDGIRVGNPGAIVSISNLLLYDMSGAALYLNGATGTLQFATVFGTVGAGAPPSLISCTAGLSVQSSIIWATGATAINGPCAVSSSIAGPAALAGGAVQTNVSQADPKFVDLTHRDLHLAADSPAIDVVGSGPALDVELTPRPQGASFDLGAYERKP